MRRDYSSIFSQKKLYFIILMIFCLTLIISETGSGWYNIRTNGFPQRPKNITIDSDGALLITSEMPEEAGVWYYPPGGDLLHISGDLRENDFGRSSNMLEKEELSGVQVNMAAEDASGNIWYATLDHGVKVEKKDGTWIHFKEGLSENAIPANSIQKIRFTSDNETILIGYLGAAVINEEFEVFQTRSWIAYTNDHINDIIKDTEDNYWVVNNRGVYRGATIEDWVAEHVEDLYPDDPKVPLINNPLTVIQEDTEGNIWFASNSFYGRDGIFCYTAQQEWEQYTVADTEGLERDIIQDITVNTGTGHVWFASQGDNAFFRYDKDAGWRAYAIVEDLGLQGRGIHCAVYDNNIIWLTTQSRTGVHGHGTGVHELLLDEKGDMVAVKTYDYITTTTSLPSNRCRGVAADKSGGVWFGAYDFKRLSYRDSEGEWTMFDGEISDGTKTIAFESSFSGIVVDSRNIVYFAQSRGAPFAYDTDNETLLTLEAPPDIPVADFLKYGVYLDQHDGKWFYTGNGVFYLSPDNSWWERYTTEDGLQSNITEGVRVDVYGNAWIVNRGGVAMKRFDGNWYAFQNHDDSGFFSNPIKIVLDDNREAWNATGQKFNYESATWYTPDDTDKLDNRNKWYSTGNIFIGPDNTKSRGIILNIDDGPIYQFNRELTTLDTQGNIYVVRWGHDNHWGVYAYESGMTYDEEYDSIIAYCEVTPVLLKEQSKVINLNMRNIGTQTWERGTVFFLGAVGNYDDLTKMWRIVLDHDVKQGESHNFVIEFYPEQTGMFTTEWQMVKEGVAWFGDIFSKEVNVIARTGIERMYWNLYQ